MIEVRKSAQRGHIDHGWLDTYHTFSFASYRDRRHRGFRSLRVINEDRIQPGQGFGTHPHQDMEIITYIVAGALAHRDSMGTGSVIRPGEIQTLSAGSGITHSEFNHSSDEDVHLLQIWILPEKSGLTPSYQQQRYADRCVPNELCLVVSPDGRDESVRIHQDACLYTCGLRGSVEITHAIATGRYVWLQVVTGRVTINGVDLASGDGCAVSDEQRVVLIGRDDADVLLFDLA